MHWQLARVIRKSIEKELNIHMNKISFLYGNIKPDLHPCSIPHYKHAALEFVQGEIKELFEHKNSKTGQWSKQLSERMGIITHYLSDFFNSFILTPKQWIEQTNAIGIISKQGRYGGTYAHQDIAFEFASWISVEFNLIPLELTTRQITNVYTSEADVLNVALFGM